ncbi:DnaT-like ssDNA-binding protein [Xanthomonas vasicola]|uniref:DnaT-like ssDNA-binding protein n=1 Tax=Xanthomonas vasicola TaxID=56459 RepID=UPI0005313482|nr:DnaT-like ssDNA-binding protein [Xanthomonas vasicola]AZR23488.1 hypothetical protein NX81_015640 [Xanthomonas vasicola]KGR38618.1 hypothetical protein NX04_19780 [Xanthomonas vasicola]TWQ34009.1 hypothetical protein FQJ96_20395 [Xanthomonas vasicola]TWQ53543.1 hypothetical protein FQJ93_20170 [Xanthomonas vasicola]TWQ72973.1 hypothetical protein FQJ89_20095 [Xanthomonas vasicola]
MYGTLAGADDYHLARGNTAWATGSEAARTAALVRGTDYIDGRYQVVLASGRWQSLFPGVRAAGRGQPNEWPRTGATDNAGAFIGPEEIPGEVERATYEAALRELARPGSLSPDFVASAQAIRKKVGPIEVAYSEKGADGGVPNRPVVTAIDEILGPLLRTPYVGPAVMVV